MNPREPYKLYLVDDNKPVPKTSKWRNNNDLSGQSQSSTRKSLAEVRQLFPIFNGHISLYITIRYYINNQYSLK